MSRNTRIALFFLVFGLAGAAGGFFTSRLFFADPSHPALSASWRERFRDTPS